MAYYPQDLNVEFDEEALTFSFNNPEDDYPIISLMQDPLAFHKEVIEWLFDTVGSRVFLTGPVAFEERLRDSLGQPPACIIGQFSDPTGAYILTRIRFQAVVVNKLKLGFNRAEHAMLFKLTWL